MIARSRSCLRHLALTAMAVVLFQSLPRSSAHADDELEWSYLVDGGIVPFVYVPILGVGALGLFASPPDTPRFFDASEGGEAYRGDTVPNNAVAAFAAVGAATVALVPREARWYHLKGFLESFATTVLLTDLAKFTIGRHRPDFDPSDPRTSGEDGHKSFFSGHASATLATSMYLGLYAYRHIFPRWRPAGSRIAWWEAATYAGLAAVSIYVPWSRVADHRHHPSDVITGSLVGASLSAGFFLYQESRFRARGERAAPRAMLVPAPMGASLVVSF